eukprot:TRINITY_DN6263_c0_g1_i1.p1 TRINITY_DN6263_c0_g1~~TRINITY_DN6263_c0_g1_i1.p1  ORF type:complete len:1383 (+),score=565.02 TRINITY_DN6263_c0_g1_i1:228-4151(+)
MVMKERKENQYEKLISSLLVVGNGEASKPCKILAAECLGELGSIDYSLLSNLNKITRPKVPLAKSDVDLAQILITNYPVKALRASRDTISQDRASCAIQELLKFCGCNLTSSQPKGSKENQNWLNFPEEVREIIKPFRNSHYELSDRARVANVERPLIKAARNYQAWIAIWAADLTDASKDKRAEIFKACRGVMKDDLETTLYLLPHLLINVINNGTDLDRERISQEMLAVLESDERTELAEMATQRVFFIIDSLNEWLEEQRKKGKEEAKDRRKKTQLEDKSLVEKILQGIPRIVMSNASLRCNAYARALFNLEYQLREERDEDFDEECIKNLPLFEQIYSRLEETDQLAAIAKCRTESKTMKEDIFDYQNAGQWADAQACFDQCLQLDPNNLELKVGLLNCLRHLGHLQTMLNIAQKEGSNSLDNTVLNSYAIQAAWRLGNWKELETLTAQPTMEDFEVEVGKSLLAIKNGNENQLVGALTKARFEVMASLAVASAQSYETAYPLLGKLHVLTELEHSFKIWKDEFSEKEWDSRINVTQPTFKTREPILTVRRAILEIFPDKIERTESQISSIWLEIAKMARKADQLQSASAAILRAKMKPNPIAYLEESKLLWTQGRHQPAIQILKEILRKYPSKKGLIEGKRKTENSNHKKEGDLVLAKTHLLYARWTQITGSAEPTELMQQYKDATEISPKWEKGHFYFGKYCDSLWMAALNNGPDIFSLTSETEIKSQIQWLNNAILCYGTSLTCGNDYIHHSLPRLLTSYLDFGAQFENTTFNNKYTKILGDVLSKMNKQISNFTTTIAPYQWYTCFPQLVSRICHPNAKVAENLSSILIAVLKEYPLPSIWLVMSVTKSNNTTRNNKATTMLSKAKQMGVPSQIIDHCDRLSTFLIDICEKNLDNIAEKTLSLAKFTNSIQKKLLKELADCKILVPTQSSLTITLPSNRNSDGNMENSGFPVNSPYMAGIEDNVAIMSSLVKPRRITIAGSDGKKYPFLCKPKDDLRRDCRMMEFNTIINKLLKKNPACRKRNLKIRTYSVVPLNEESGIIEWVENTSTMRSILQPYYAKLAKPPNAKRTKELYDKAGPSIYDRFVKEILPQYKPPVFHNWFLEKFTNPSAWFEARSSFSKTSAVMSMIGYIVNLGDRHLENLLLDSTNGDCIHVDFNCLFGKGLTFEKPEKVPFRLTHNMTDAMGSFGVEGTFRRVAELCLGILRSNRETLLSVLETFLHDPLVDWTKSSKINGNSNGADKTLNEKAVKAINDINDRLQGKGNVGIPLTVEGQVAQQIERAVSLVNLSEMYIGWAAYQ